MLTPLAEILEERRAAGAAAGAFTAYGGETVLGVVRAAEERNVPLIILLSAASFRGRDGRLFASLLLGVASAAAVPVCVELDHVHDERLIRDALELGVGAVMADGSRLPYQDNVAFVRGVRDLVASYGAQVEAELGRVEGDEDVSRPTGAGALTDPDEARAFACETGTNCLAVSIGNVHGTYATPPDLDFDRLRNIRAATEIPLSLHGASGLDDADLRRAVTLGVCKVNVNTEIREHLVSELERRLPSVRNGANLLALNAALVDAVADVTAAKLALLDPLHGKPGLVDPSTSGVRAGDGDGPAAP